MWWWWWRENNWNVVVVVLREENNRILWPENRKMRNILPLSQSLSFCSVYENSLSRRDSMQRLVMSKHRNAGLIPFQTVPMFSQNVSGFASSILLHLHYCRNDRVLDNGLGSVSVAISFRDHLPFPGEDRLVLFTKAACVYTNVSRHATHWIR